MLWPNVLGQSGTASPAPVFVTSPPRTMSAPVVAIAEGDGQRVRQLPKEDDGEQHCGTEAELTAGCEPPGYRRQRAGDGADQHAERAARLERRVRAEIEDGGGEGESGHRDADADGEIRHTPRREDAGEKERLQGLEPGVPQRAPARAPPE